MDIRNDGQCEGALDSVVANTYASGDHTGKNSLMSVAPYYPDLDWAQRGASKYVPIKEGGG